MPLVAVDASRANAHERTGTEWYAYHVIQGMKRLDAEDLEFILYSRKFLRDGLEEFPAGWYGKILAWRNLRLWNQFRLSWELYRHPADLLFQPTHTLPLYRPKRVVTTIHDIGFERNPKLYRPAELNYHRYSARLAAKVATRLLTVSEFSKREIMEVYGVPEERIVVTPNAVDTARYHADITEEQKLAVLQTYRLTKPFFLFVGRLEEKKNLANILRAFATFKERRGIGDPVKLLLAGTPGFGYDRIAKVIKDHGLAPHLLMPGYVPEADLPALTAAAEGLVFATLYEGFGIPVIQAQAVGTPAIVSNTTALPEVAGDGALFVNPLAPEEIADAMHALVDDMPRREAVRAAGFENVKRFSWDETARITMRVIQEALT